MVRPSLILASLAVLASAAPASAASPKLSSAASFDRDGDGRVDAVTVRFGAKVKGKGKFSVAGRRVSSVGKARGRRVELRLAESGGCDLGLLPRVKYTSGLRTARGRRVRPSRLDMARRDRRAPRLTCAVTADSDGNGHVDGVVLTWSKAVKGGIASAFRVEGFSVRRASAPRGRNLTLVLSEHASPDTGVTPAVAYNRVAKDGVRGRGGQAFPGSLQTTRDGAAPMLSAARTSDSDLDGLVDTIFAAFSEPVTAAPNGPRVSGAEVTGTAPNGNELTLGVAEGPLDTGAQPLVSYGAGDITDAAGNSSAALAFTPADGAGPLITAARTQDLNADGRLDAVLVTFSEPVSHPADSDGNYPLEVPGYTLAGVEAASGNTVQVGLQQASGPDTGLLPGVRYARGAGSPVLDLAGNEALPATFAGVADGAAPALTGATTLDRDEDGSLDHVRFRFSEGVFHMLGTGSFSVQGFSAQAPLTADGNGVDVPLTELAGTNTGALPLTFYVPPGLGGVSDLSGNLAPAGSVVAGDGAGPVVVAGTTGDADSDHRIDRVHVTMSEPVTYAGDSTAPFAIGAEGYTVESVGAASGSSFTIDLVEPTQPDTGGAPDVSYAAGGLLRDLAGVEAVAKTFSDRTRDTLPPAFVAAETADADGNGRLDRVDLRYSEDVQGGSGTAPFSVSGRTVTGIEFSGPRARIVISEAGTPDTADRPSASYSPPAQAAERVKDVPEGIGDTADDAPGQSSIQADDKAAPAIVQATTADIAGTPDGRIDRVTVRFSEIVHHDEDLTGPFPITLAAPHLVSSVSAAVGTDVTLGVTPQLQPDGGSKPDVTVIDPAAVLDDAGNPAFGGAFTGTLDGVSPVMVSAKTGERDGSGTCVVSPPQNGALDCLIVNWSEPVSHANDPSLLVAGFSVASPIPAVTDSPVTEVPLVEGATPDRDRSGTVAYTAPAGVPVVDATGLEALSTTPNVLADAACADDLSEPNDSRLVDNPVAGESFGALVCAGDEDWFRVPPDGSELHVMMNPENGSLLRIELWDASGGTALAGVSAVSSGDPVTLDLTGLADPYYWIRVFGTGPTQEGQYCLDTQFESGDTCEGAGGEPL